MALRLSFAAVVVAFFLVACGDSSKSSASSSGGSAGAVTSTLAGSSGGGAQGSSDAAGGSVGGTSAGSAGSGGAGNGFGGAGAGGSLGNSSGSGGMSEPANVGGAEVGGATDASTSAAGSAGTVGGYPSNWIVLPGVDYSMIPGPNFQSVKLMFQGAHCSGSNCHFGGRNHLTVDKADDQLYSYMIGFKTLECGKLIDTTNPSQSALVKYLRGPCGSIERMPSYSCVDDGDEDCVPEYYIQAIEQWIAMGAPR